MNKENETSIYLSPAIVGYILSFDEKDREEEYNEIVADVKYYGRKVIRNDIYRFWTKQHPVEVWHDGINYYEDNVYDAYFLNEKYNAMYEAGTYREFIEMCNESYGYYEKFCLEAYEDYKQENSDPEL